MLRLGPSGTAAVSGVQTPAELKVTGESVFCRQPGDLIVAMMAPVSETACNVFNVSLSFTGKDTMWAIMAGTLSRVEVAAATERCCGLFVW